MSGLSLFVVGALLFNCVHGGIYTGCIDEENCRKQMESCVGSVKFFDGSDKQIHAVSHTTSPDERLPVKTSGGKARLEGNCCFEARQKPVEKGGKTAMFTDNKDYPLEFNVKYMIKSECPPHVPGAGTPWIPIVITVAVVAVLAIIAVIVFVKKRNSGHTPINTQP